jgi:phospholipid/cholesterol/gamma-HCH transport system ATP-binding protein
MLRVEGVQKSFAAHTVLRDVSFRLPAGSIGGLIGPSGSGKSVLLKIIGGVISASKGMVTTGTCIDDEDSQIDLPNANTRTDLPEHLRNTSAGCRAMSLMFQEGALFDSFSVLDNVAFPLVSGNVPLAILPLRQRTVVAQAALEMLDRVGLRAAAHKFPGQLSGGMRRRVSLARALVPQPRVLLLDDPTCGLDPVASSVIMQLIVDLHRELKPTTLIVSHDLRRLLPNVEQVVALFNGSVCFQGTLAALATPQMVGEACSLPKESSLREVRHFVSCRYDLANAA